MTPRPARQKTAVFRADASTEIGSGHIVRCLTLADSLAQSGWRCAFAAARGSAQVVPSLRQSAHTLILVDEGELAKPGALWRRRSEEGAILFVDSYRLDRTYESESRRWARKVVVIDDLAERAHDCDLLIDQTIGREEADYSDLVPRNCAVLAGPAYALLRPAFRNARAAASRRRSAGEPVRRILVNIGATDPANLTATALKGVELSGLKVEIDVVLGPSAPHVPAVRALAQTLSNGAALHVGAQDMAALMSRADVAIGAAGTSALERCCLGLPSIVVVAAENQRYQAQTLAASGMALVLVPQGEVGPRDIADALVTVANDGALRASLSRAGMAACDGRGADRVEAAIARICM